MIATAADVVGVLLNNIFIEMIKIEFFLTFFQVDMRASFSLHLFSALQIHLRRETKTTNRKTQNKCAMLVICV